ncbi:amino acid adenylation domain-containing protein [Amycolatopsis sp. OK19-0408]|uniref:Amino acid adenylation domain-containing protein n=1 Tax=Amycolatopsis iheyensis TaxID=2945988 RepID=A0A9X2NJ64_9PSEU|nr:non-ribosomal peptide synthetase [Amycolatopsis iheyensis]MCR6488451.1 amino acid adenylation domain-containing protein [Amycolatopsis iheyensis]
MRDASRDLREIARRYDAGELSTTELRAELAAPAKLPLSEGQRGLWALHKMEPETYSYNVPVCLSCTDVDAVLLEKALHDTVSRHPILASAVREDDDGPHLVSLGAGRFRVERADISDVPADGVLDHLKERAKQPFDLADGPLVRVSVLTRAEAEVYVLVVVHHVILDGPSLCLVLDTLLHAYRARVEGREPPAGPDAADYGEFVAWERDFLDGEPARRDRDFWRRELAGRVPLTGLPTHATLPPDAPHEGEVHAARLSREQADAVTAFAAAHEVVPAVLLLAVFKTLLYRYTGQEDIVVGMPVAARPSGRFESTVGYFVNVLPIRSKPADDLAVPEFARRLQATVFEALDRASYPFPRIVRETGDRGDLRSPVFQAVFNYQNFSLTGRLGELAAELRDTWSFQVVAGLHQLGEYDLTLDVVPGDGFELYWKYHPGAFSAATVAGLADHFGVLLDALLAGDGPMQLGRVRMLAPAERRLVLDEWNRTDVEYPGDRTVWELFAERAAAHPDRPAVSCGDRTLTYGELADRASALAEALLRRGVRAGDRVGASFERTLDLSAGLLAIMKTGAAYVPLDPGLPAERLSYLVEDSGAGLVVCDEASVAALSDVDLRGAALHVLDRPDVPAAEPGDAVARPGAAYVIYTSGSTGKPKGVVVSHRSLTNLLLSVGRTLGITPDDRLPAIATYSFDIAALELFLPLITGGQCRIHDAATVKDATLLAAELTRWGPTVVQATPVTWAMLLRVGWRNTGGAKVLCTGEALPEHLKDRLVALGAAWNLYGPTETTLYSSMKRLGADEPVTIGTPVANTRLYVLDRHAQPVPVGVPGELCIAGHGVALGYHGKPRLTAERFVEDPFVPGGRMYRTGDVVRRLPNGELVVLGRMDDQVKLRGYRIEPGEIEAALDGHPDVAASVVVVERDRLTAYLTLPGGALDEKALRAHLEKTLPAYMVPSAFVVLASFPLTASGKIDRARLRGAGDRTPAAPARDASGSSRAERALRRIFTAVLGRDDIDREGGFFDAGGDSFSAIEVVTEINRVFGRDLRPTALFAHASIAAMARHLEEPAAASRDVAAPAAVDREYLDDAVAVVGISCRFPGAGDHRAFWTDLKDGKAGNASWSPEELRALGVPDELVGRAGYVPHRPGIEGTAEFDAAFFGISPRDAEFMDPQGRLLLLHAWKALEDAGHRPEDVPRTSVFTSVSNNFYQALLPSLMENAAGTRVLASTESYAAWLLAQGGTVPTMISSRLGLGGPSMAVSSNCSSALSGLHLACQGLRSGEADQAVVGAASLGSTMELGYVHQPGLNFSSDGRCRAFDDAADGMTGGEGVGVVVLKRARDAIADGDHVYCLIRGVAVNNDGGAKAGFYAPSVRGQADVIRAALDASGVDPETIRYVEAHGTGTKLGDPVEVEALTEAYRHYTDRRGYVGIGSVKSNIGHLDAAAGIAGLIKLALSLHHGEVPKTLHCSVPNRAIDWANSPFFVTDRNLSLESSGAEPVRAGLSSFGIGGTNAHAVLERADLGVSPSAEGPHLVVLSARDGSRLEALAGEFLSFLPGYAADGGDLASLAYTLQVGRRPMAVRMAFVVDGFDELIEQLESCAAGHVPDGAFGGSARRGDDELVSLFARTAQLKELGADWVERGDWEKVAALWVSGIDVEWDRYYGPTPPRRVSLPTYPFDTKRFWPATTQNPPTAPPVASPATRLATPPAASPAAQPEAAPATSPGSSGAEALLVAAAGADGVDRFLARRRQTTAEMNAILRRLLVAQLWSAGVFREPGRRGVLATSHAKWFDHTVTVLADEGELSRAGDLPRTPDLDGAWRAWRAWTAAHEGDPELAAKTTVTTRSLEALPDILAGRSTATAVLFPGGSFDLVEAVYNRNIASDYFNCALADEVRAEVGRLRGDARSGLRILEVGAGTGSASKWIFERLADVEGEIAEYSYTDISKAFLNAAEKRFSRHHSYLTYRVFDAERSPASQGFAVGEYDVVVANNVLHATRDITETVEHVRALLRPGGVLLLNEVTANEWWAHLAFGFLDGWFRHADGRRIPGGPALSADSWREVLRGNGFDAVGVLGGPARELGMQIVSARASHPTEPERPTAEYVEDALARCLVESLKLTRDELQPDAPFADYGLDSLTGVTMVGMLNEALGTDLDASVLFDNPSIRRLTKFLVEEHGGDITAHRPKDKPRVEEVRPREIEPQPVTGSSRSPEAQPTRSQETEPPPATEAPRLREPIAIIGMSGRFPSARDLDEFWRQMAEGHDPVTPVTRWDLPDGQTTCRHGGFMTGIDEFDPLFFGISGAEAGYMEPQQRLFLQEAWNALEDAGHAGASIDRERCGIYVGSGGGDYFDLTSPFAYPAQAYWGNMNSMVPARLAYYLDLHGPAMTVNTACSSSLTAVYLACQGLWTGETDLALAGGVAVQCSPRVYVAGSRAGMLAPSGRSRSFDAAADGFVPAEGAGVIVLKRLSDAEADGDHIHGVVRGIGLNQDGTSNGITAPNGSSQESLIRRVHREFGIDTAGIQLVEAHGTGTKLGDPVEFNALTRAFRATTDKAQFCSLGSVKANIGHALEAAGVAGIIKTLLAMKYGTIPGLLHFREANPSVVLAGSPFFVHTEPRDWVAPPGDRRRAAVTSLGASGTNVHAVIEEAPARPRRATPAGPRLVALSARTDEALREQLTRLARHCRAHPDLDLADVSYSLLLGRKHFPVRWACVANDLADLQRKLSGEGEPGPAPDEELSRLAAEYVDGGTPDFAALFRDGHRVPLPGYPFERGRYPLPDRPRSPERVVLTGTEFFLREHRVRGTAIVPGAMYLEWVRAAVAQSAGEVVCLRDIAFLRPLDVVGGAREVHVAVRADGGFQVSSTDSSDTPVTHCEGRLATGEGAERRTLDLPALLRDLRRTPMEPDRFYAEYREHGVDYGPAFRGCVAGYEGDGTVLAQLELPEGVTGEFPLHPVLVDSALQAMRLLPGTGTGDAEGGLTFAIERAEILRPCTAKMWAWIRRGPDAGRIDVDLAGENGEVCLALRGITVRRAGAEPAALTLLPSWDPVRESDTGTWPSTADVVGVVAASPAAREVLAARYPAAHVLPAYGSQREIDDAVRDAPLFDHLIWVAPEHAAESSADRLIDAQSAGTLQVFRTVKAVLAAGYGDRRLGWTLITHRAHAVHETELIDPAHAGIAGLAGSTAKEYPLWTVRVADVEAYDDDSLAAVLSQPADPDGDLRIHRAGTWYRQRLLPVRAGAPESSRFREGGTYVIAGGAGGLGVALTEHLIRRYRAQVVWLGRRPRDARVEAAIGRAAGSGGPPPHYIRADATSAAALRAARAETDRRFGPVHGVVQSGLVFAGASLARMTEAEFHDVLRSKVDASVRLLDAWGGDSLELALFLSSINSYLKAIKQANYAAACTFMDSFAATVPQRHGCVAKVINLGYCFTNATDGAGRSTLLNTDVPLISPDEFVAAVERLCAGPASRLTLTKSGPARGITVGDDEVLLLPDGSPAAPPAGSRAPREEFDDLDELRARVADLTALAI